MATCGAMRQIHQFVHNLHVKLYSTDANGTHFHLVTELHTERQPFCQVKITLFEYRK